MIKMKEEHEANEIDVHEILMGDVEDPDLMIAAPIYCLLYTSDAADE